MSGPECCSNSPVLNPNAGAGHVEKLAALDSYLSGSPNSIAILLVSDVFGTLSSQSLLFFLHALILVVFLIKVLFDLKINKKTISYALKKDKLKRIIG